MGRSLSYADAARLLGGTDSRIVTALEKTAGWLMLGTAPVLAEVLSWFDAKAELGRLSRQLVRDLSERRSGLSRHGRTERIEAAHTVIVVAAFFESLAEVRLPAGEQIALATGGPAGPDDFVTLIMSAGDRLPGPERPLSDFRRDLRFYYEELAERLIRFLTGLSSFEDRRLSEAVYAAVHPALNRYDDALLRLTADFPEVAYWADRREQRAARVALTELGTVLLAVHTGRAPDERRAGLAAAYRDDLRLPVADSGDRPDGITVPPLADAYLPPRFRVYRSAAPAVVSDEGRWSVLPVRDDLRDFLAGHLTSPRATRAPLLVLGQPGSGKSVLTRVLAAGLPASEFLPVRVVLRDTPALDQIQDQIEHALRAATGEHIGWPALARSAGDALPLVLLDGFDELLQATGVSQTDYLERVAAFQRREAVQGRPVAVVVTSRIAVANRARAPEDTVTLRLEPFDEQQITAWLDVWNRANTTGFAARGLATLPAATVLAHRHLAEQPLLLLMLALYDAARGNALQRGDADLRQDQLYERLLRSFAYREVFKSRPGLSERDREAAVDDELRRLSVVAFAMFNRSALWIGEAELENDLTGLLGPTPTAPVGLRPALRPAELTLGRFFFIHRARSGLHDKPLQTYEFLHATFNEFFVARLTWQALLDMGAQASASTSPFGPTPVHDDLLRTLLSHQPLSRRATIVDFLTEMAWASGEAVRATLRGLLLRVFQGLRHTPEGPRYAGYRPSGNGEPARYAVYSANLLLLLTCVSDRVLASELFPDHDDAVGAWSRQAHLWHSQTDGSGWDGFVERLAVERITSPAGRDVRVAGYTDRWTASPINLSWTLDWSPPTDRPAWLRIGTASDEEDRRRTANFMCRPSADITQHALDALAVSSDWNLDKFVSLPGAGIQLPVNAIFDLWTDPRIDAFRRCLTIATCEAPAWAEQIQLRCAEMILERLALGRPVPPPEAADLLERLHESMTPFRVGRLTSGFLHCLLAYLGHGRELSHRLAALAEAVLMPDLGGADPILAADALVRLHELGLPVPAVLELRSRDRFDALVRKVTGRRPDLVQRLAALAPPK
ncbi:hypothetical protein Q0Z83_058890 [Actinoplanes sichuanensis]|uniref:NACHT domain-containing protein n=1 Tax=Actinoplanes sichuanensis TaxID=512349 RepID=A0ABW4AP65_9ACTN|nr:hypothetical protein [Actinoplanes sichuanensis]BEL07698.1 hypothetical protein Q0Z83_058890 [Actinoplanes sichuanensis]